MNSAVNAIYEFAISQWPIPEALRYIVHEPHVPSALKIIGFAAALHKGMWPKHVDQLDNNCKNVFYALTLLLECSDDMYPQAVSICKESNLQSLCDFADSMRANVISGRDQFKFNFSKRRKVSIDLVEWYYEDIVESLKIIYAAGIRAYGGSVAGDELLRLVKKFRVPELWHEVVFSGRKPDGPFEIMSWIASQRECDTGTVLKIMHIIGFDAIDDPLSPEAQLTKKILANFKANFYKSSKFTGIPLSGAALDGMGAEEAAKFLTTLRLEKARSAGRDLPLSNDGFGIILGISEHPRLNSGKRAAVNAFGRPEAKGVLGSAFQFLRGRKS